MNIRKKITLVTMKITLSIIIITCLFIIVTSNEEIGTQNQLNEKIKLWDSQNIKSYTASLTQKCSFCDSGQFTINVEGNDITSCDSTTINCQKLYTVESLFVLLQDAIDYGYARYSYEFDYKFGYLKYIYAYPVIYILSLLN